MKKHFAIKTVLRYLLSTLSTNFLQGMKAHIPWNLKQESIGDTIQLGNSWELILVPFDSPVLLWPDTFTGYQILL